MPPFGFVLPGAPETKGNFEGRGAAFGILAEWLRRLIRNQLGTFPREFESLGCRLLLFIYLFFFFWSRWQLFRIVGSVCLDLQPFLTNRCRLLQSLSAFPLKYGSAR